MMETCESDHPLIVFDNRHYSKVVSCPVCELKQKVEALEQQIEDIKETIEDLKETDE